MKRVLQQSQDMLVKEEKKQGLTKFVFQQEQRKLTNNMAKVEIAIAEFNYNLGNSGNEDSFQKATNQLEMVLTDSKELDPQLLSQCYQKLSSWQFEFLESNKNTLEVRDEDYKKIVDNCARAT